MNEYEAIVILAAAFIIVYIIGSVSNRRLLVRYSRILKGQVQSDSEFVGFRPFGSSGFRALVNMKKDVPLSKVEIAVSLVDRENVMHYPLSLLTREHDKVTMWAFLRTKPSFSIEICSKATKSFPKRPEWLALEATAIEKEGLEKQFQVASSAKIKAKGLLSNDRLASSLMRVGRFLEYLLIDESESRIFMVGRLTEDSLGLLLDIVMVSGEHILRSQAQT